MKQLIKFSLLIAILGVFSLPARSDAGVRVTVRIGPPVRTVRVLRPRRPYYGAVWVNGHYVYRHGHYVYAKGVWIKPRPHHVYVQPHWRKSRHGYYFVPGHWRRV